MPFASVAKRKKQNVKLPIGIEDFAELRKKNYYFVDNQQLNVYFQNLIGLI